MAVQNSQLEIKPYESTVPVPQISPAEIDGQTRPAQPLQGQFGRKGTGALAIGDSIVKGLILGHAEKEKRKLGQAQATIAAADSSADAAYQKYQDALSTAGGKVDDPQAKAAYDAYMGVFNQGKEAKAKFVMPEHPPKGQKGAGGKDGKSKVPGMGGIKDFFEANPHIIPSIALMTMQPKPQGQSREAKVEGQEDEIRKQQLTIGSQNVDMNRDAMVRQKEEEQRQGAEREVHEKGGVDAVIADKNAPPQLKQAANRMKFEALDKESPEGKMKMQLLQDIQSGESKSWTPEKRMMAGIMGAAPPLETQKVTGKNGHEQQVLIDPMTNQPVAGSKPLDLGPPVWAQEFYAKRAADKADLRKAVASDPTAYGITVGPDEKANKAAIEARTEQMFVKAEFGIQSTADMFGKTGYEVQRDNDQLQGLVKELQLNGKTSWLDEKPPTLTYPDGKTTTVGRGYMNAIMHQFITSPSENAGIMAYRDTPSNPDGKSPETLDAERKFLYQFVKNHLITQKGKQALTSDQADAFLKRTALGQTVAARTGMAPPPQAVSQQAGAGLQPPPKGRFGMSGGFIPTFGGLAPPPQAGGQQSAQASSVKLFRVPGYDAPVQLSDEEAAKAKAANIPIEELSPDLMNQFLGK